MNTPITYSVGQLFGGGIIFFVDNTEQHGLIAAINDFGTVFINAIFLCDTLNLNGYNDWYLPSNYELTKLIGNTHYNNLINFSNDFYWSSTSSNNNEAFYHRIDGNFISGGIDDKLKYYRVRAIRAF